MSLRDSARKGDGRKWEYSQEGDETGGIIIGRSTFTGEYDPAEMLTVEAEYIVEGGQESTPETLKILCGNTVLRSKVEELNPQVGDEVALYFKGKKEPKSGGEAYSDFNFRVVRSTLRSQTAGEAASGGSDADW